MFDSVFPKKSEQLRLFLTIFYHDFETVIQNAIKWLDNPSDFSGFDNAIADLINEVIEDIPFVGIISQTLENIAGLSKAICNKKKNILLFNTFGYNLYDNSTRYNFLQNIFSHENTVFSINFAMLANTVYANKKEIIFSNHILPRQHQWLKFLARVINTTFINNICVESMNSIMIDKFKLSSLFKKAIYIVTAKYMDSQHQPALNIKQTIQLPSIKNTKQYINKIIVKIQAQWRAFRDKQKFIRLQTSALIICKLLKHRKKCAKITHSISIRGLSLLRQDSKVYISSKHSNPPTVKSREKKSQCTIS